MIGRFPLPEVAARLQAAWSGPAAECSGVSTDTRTLQPGDLFVALRGETHDGHHHLDEAARRGAVAAVVEQPVASGLPQLQVYDSRRALGELAVMNRERFRGRLAALTGSAGKTTTKNMIAAILAQAGDTLATRGNLNNEIGVPLTLLALQEQHRFAVVEMGAARRGDIAYLMQFVKPDVVLVTNALPAHLTGFGSLEVIAQTKGEIYQCLPETAVAVLNVDDAHAGLWREYIGKRQLLTCGWQSEHKADVTAVGVRADDEGYVRFTLVLPSGELAVALPVPGFQNVSNALGAAAVALALGCTPEQIVCGLEGFRNEPGRLTLRASRSGCRLVDDSYNANPGSVLSAIDWLAQMPSPRVLVLGEMAELGDESERYHIEVAQYAHRRGIERLWLVGPCAAAMCAAVGDGARARAFASQAELIDYAAAHVTAADTVLVKGSRRARMETVVQALAAGPLKGEQ